MTDYKDLLGQIHGGRVLDVATGQGRFTTTLKDCLASYLEIIGVDNTTKAMHAFQETFRDPAIHFAWMDAAALEFQDESFDTVAISYSLHHFPDPRVVLQEMRRVLRPGGAFIVSEMYRDNQVETQLTHVLLHDWWAAVNTACGVNHYPTYTRREILALLDELEFAALETADLNELDEDPHDIDTLQQLEHIIDVYIHERLQGMEAETQLIDRGEVLRRRLHRVGAHGASVMVAIGRKS